MAGSIVASDYQNVVYRRQALTLPLKLLQVMTRPAVAMAAFRWFIVGCEAATLWITWPLWQVHDRPPMLPLLPLPAFDMGYLLMFSLAVIMVKPWWGITLHTLLVVYAILIDQIRIQPEVVSLTLIMWGTLPNWNAKSVARASLIALWTWAGINKLLSPVFLQSTGPGLINTFLVSSGVGKLLNTHIMPDASEWLRLHGGYIIGITELSMGLLAIVPLTRKLSTLTAYGLHLSILFTLSPMGRDWNESVWPWNLGLAVAGLGLIAFWKESPVRSLKKCSRKIRALILFILISPVGFYFGMINPYLAHNLYSSNVPRVTITTALPVDLTWSVFKVPLPPEHRLFEQYFQLTCDPGDRMTIRDTRWWFRKKGAELRQVTCNAK